MTLPPEIAAALVALALTVIAGIGTVVKVLTDKISAELKQNTKLTQQVHQQTNGTLAAARQDATKYRAIAERLNWILREVNATPEGRVILDKVMDKHRAVVHDRDYDAMLRRLMGEQTK